MYPPSSFPRKDFTKQGEGKKPGLERHIVGLIVFDGEKFLLLHRVLNWSGWEYPKGGIEPHEEVAKAIARELFEETGITEFELVGKIDEFRFLDKVRNADVFVQSHLVRVSSNHKIVFDNQPLKDGKKVVEHDDFRWCFPAEAVKLLTHSNSKRSLKRAIKMLGVSMEK